MISFPQTKDGIDKQGNMQACGYEYVRSKVCTEYI